MSYFTALSSPELAPWRRERAATSDAATRNRDLQSRLPDLSRFSRIPRAPRTVVIIPSLSLDQDVMARVTGAHHYEERMLCMLMLLKLPRTRIVYVTSQPVSEEITSLRDRRRWAHLQNQRLHCPRPKNPR